MYRLWEEETVFILAGPEEAGKKISTARQPRNDFRAAYGRPPEGAGDEGSASRRGGRPDAKAPAQTSITVRFPAD